MMETINKILSNPNFTPPENILNLNFNTPMKGLLKQLSKEVCVKFAVGEARQVLHIWEDEYPNDLRPRKAIEAAEAWLNASADASVYASVSAYSDDAAAYSAAISAAASAKAAAKLISTPLRLGTHTCLAVFLQTSKSSSSEDCSVGIESISFAFCCNSAPPIHVVSWLLL